MRTTRCDVSTGCPSGRGEELGLEALVIPSETESTSIKNGRLTPPVERGWWSSYVGGQTPQAVALAVGVCPRTVRKWVARFAAEGPGRFARPIFAAASLAPAYSGRDHSRAFESSAAPALDRRQQIAWGRDRRLESHRLAHPGGPTRAQPLAGTGTRRARPPLDQRQHPGELIPTSISRSSAASTGSATASAAIAAARAPAQPRGQGLGWEFVHVCIDDASRIAFAQVHARREEVKSANRLPEGSLGLLPEPRRHRRSAS